MARLSLDKLSPEGRTVLMSLGACVVAYLAFNREHYLWFLPRPVLAVLAIIHDYWVLAFYVRSLYGLLGA